MAKFEKFYLSVNMFLLRILHQTKDKSSSQATENIRMIILERKVCCPGSNSSGTKTILIFCIIWFDSDQTGVSEQFKKVCAMTPHFYQ